MVFSDNFVNSIVEVHKLSLINANVSLGSKILFFLQNSEDFLAFSLMDLWIVDNLKFYTDFRFQINYLIYSYVYQKRWILRLSFNSKVIVESVMDLYPSANWLEREAWDLFGICFFNHSDLRRILTDYGFNGHPLLKDFPLTGYVEVRFDLMQNKVIQEKIKLVQEYRTFDFITPWSV